MGSNENDKGNPHRTAIHKHMTTLIIDYCCAIYDYDGLRASQLLHWTGSCARLTALWAAYLHLVRFMSTCKTLSLAPLPAVHILWVSALVCKCLADLSQTGTRQSWALSVAGRDTWNGLSVSLRLAPSASPAMFFSGLRAVRVDSGWAGNASE